MKRCHTESRAGNRGRKWFPSPGNSRRSQDGHLAALLAVLVAALMGKSAGRR